MDAGRVQFVAGADLDLKLANGFKNTDVFCVRDGLFVAIRSLSETI